MYFQRRKRNETEQTRLLTGRVRAQGNGQTSPMPTATAGWHGARLLPTAGRTGPSGRPSCRPLASEWEPPPDPRIRRGVGGRGLSCFASIRSARACPSRPRSVSGLMGWQPVFHDVLTIQPSAANPTKRPLVDALINPLNN